MGNRPHPHRRQDNIAFMTDAEFETECNAAYADGKAIEAAEKAARIKEYESSPEQRDWDHDDMCESEFITEAGMYSPCQCKDRDAE